MSLHDRLAAALQAVAETNEKTTAADAAMARLRAAIDDVPNHQGAVNGLVNEDAAAFERYARNGGDVPAIDARTHDKARQALVAAQAKAQAANTALAKIQAERAKAHAYGQAAQAALQPLAAQIVLAKRVPELLAEADELRTQFWHKAAQAEEARALVYSIAESLPKGGPEAHELLVFAEKLSNEIRHRKSESRPADANAIRSEWMQEIGATIDAANETETENEIA